MRTNETCDDPDRSNHSRIESITGRSKPIRAGVEPCRHCSPGIDLCSCLATSAGGKQVLCGYPTISMLLSNPWWSTSWLGVWGSGMLSGSC